VSGAARGPLRPLSVAPMMDRTDRHYRWFMRRITKRCLLYSEMVVTAALIHGDRQRLLDFDPEEKPLALQLGGDDPAALAECARIAADFGYDEIDLNVGCPSERVRLGSFGACLMAEPEKVARAVEAMRRAVELPVTVKHRIGIDELDRYEDLRGFVRVVAAAGCDRFIVHARTAVLGGLSPRENRTAPPLRHEEVHRLKREHPQLRIEINGGFVSLEQVRGQLGSVDGVMIGRAAYETPFMLAAADRQIFGDARRPPSRREILAAMLPYVESWRGRGLSPGKITRHLLGLCAGRPGARAFRRHLGEHAHHPEAGAQTLLDAARLVPDAVLDERAGQSSAGKREGAASRINS